MNNLDLGGLAPGLDEGPSLNIKNEQPEMVHMLNIPKAEPSDGYGNFISPGENGMDVEGVDVDGLYNELDNLEDVINGINTQPIDVLPVGENFDVLMATGETYIDLVGAITFKVEQMLARNRNKQAKLAVEIQTVRDAGNVQKKKVPVLMYLPPYFKDENMFCAPLSDEGKQRQKVTNYDPLMKEEKKWSAHDIKRLKTSVRSAMLQIHLEPLYIRRETLVEKVKSSGQDADTAEVMLWKQELEVIKRKILFANDMKEEDLIAMIDNSKIDWAKISNVDFKGLRTAQAIRLKWTNEVSPCWNNEPWTEEEGKKLKRIRESDLFNSWGMLADRLGSRRTPWQCFVKYKREIWTEAKEWTPEEDEKLITLCGMMQVNGNIQWDKVTYYMPGRNRQQVRVRYVRTLDKNVKHGRWADQEDLLLLCAVNRFGAQDWSKIAKAVPGRTDTQCRERWVSVLDRRVAPKEWTLREDEQLLFLISVFGRNQWVKCAQFLENRNGDNCRYRYQSLINTKIRLCSAKNILHTRDVTTTEFNARTTMKKVRVNRVYRKYNNLMESCEDVAEGEEGVDKLMNFVEQKERENIEKKPFNARKKLTDEEKAKVNEGLQEIQERHKNGDAADIGSLLAQIKVEPEDVANHMKRKERMSGQKSEKALTTGDPTRKGRKVRLPQSQEEPEEVSEAYAELMNNTDVTEKEKRVGLHAILMDTVERHDLNEWNGDFARLWCESGAVISEDIVHKALTSTLRDQVRKLWCDEQLGDDESLSMSFVNADFNAVLQKDRPRLLREAGAIFHRNSVGINDPAFSFEIDVAKFESSDSLHISLADDITNEQEYLELKAIMRNVLLEPMMFENACLREEEFANESKNDIYVCEREMERQALWNGIIQPPATRNFASAIVDYSVRARPLSDIADPYKDTLKTECPLALPPLEVFSRAHRQGAYAGTSTDSSLPHGYSLAAGDLSGPPGTAHDAVMDINIHNVVHQIDPHIQADDDSSVSTPTAPANPVEPRRRSRLSGAHKWKTAIEEKFEDQNGPIDSDDTPRSSHSHLRRRPSAKGGSIEEATPKKNLQDQSEETATAETTATPSRGRSTKAVKKAKVAEGGKSDVNPVDKEVTEESKGKAAEVIPDAPNAEVRPPPQMKRAQTRAPKRPRDLFDDESASPIAAKRTVLSANNDGTLPEESAKSATGITEGEGVLSLKKKDSSSNEEHRDNIDRQIAVAHSSEARAPRVSRAKTRAPITNMANVVGEENDGKGESDVEPEDIAPLGESAKKIDQRHMPPESPAPVRKLPPRAQTRVPSIKKTNVVEDESIGGVGVSRKKTTESPKTAKSRSSQSSEATTSNAEKAFGVTSLRTSKRKGTDTLADSPRTKKRVGEGAVKGDTKARN